MPEPTDHPTTPDPDRTTPPERFTHGLIADVLAVLDRHGYVRGDDRAVGATVGHLAALVEAYERPVDA